MRRALLLLLPLALILLPASSLRAQAVCSLDWPLEETLRIGSFDGEDALGYVVDLAVDPASGEIYVPQGTRGEVLVFSAEGQLIRQIGREGSGPGDFEAGPRSVTWVDGTLWVADRFRAQSFGPDAQPRDFVAFHAPMLHEGAHYRPDAPLADGSFWARRSSTSRRGGPGGRARVTVARFERDGTPLDTIAVLDVDRWRLVSDGGGFSYHPLWADLPGAHPQPEVTSDRSAIVVVTGVGVDDVETASAFGLQRISLSGNTLMRREIPYDPVPITSEEREWWFTEFAATRAGDYTQGRPRYPRMNQATRNRNRREARDLLWLPDYYPPVRRVLAGADDTIWLQREFDVLGRWDQWEVYDASGELVGRVELDGGRHHTVPWLSSLRVLQASREEVWATSVDEYEIPYIHRYRVDRGC